MLAVMHFAPTREPLPRLRRWLGAGGTAGRTSCDHHQRPSKSLGHPRQMLGRPQQQRASAVQELRSGGRIDLRCDQSIRFDANCIEVLCHLNRFPVSEISPTCQPQTLRLQHNCRQEATAVPRPPPKRFVESLQRSDRVPASGRRRVPQTCSRKTLATIVPGMRQTTKRTAGHHRKPLRTFLNEQADSR